MRLINLIFLIIFSSTLYAHDYLPGEKQGHPILLQGGDLYTVSGEILRETDILFENGLITRIGTDISLPSNCKVIDVTGKNIYPGLIAPMTTLGLTEIGAVRATNDIQEAGQITPEVKAHVAYNPDSELLPVVRANGITTVQVTPRGSMLRGRSSILNLDGWTIEDAAVKLIDGLHLAWPNARINKAWYETRSIEQQKKAIKNNSSRLRIAFEEAKAYWLAKKENSELKVDLRWEAMIPIFDKKLPVFIYADDYRQIEEAVYFSKEQNINMILVGGRESWKLTELLSKYNIPVIYGIVYSTPYRSDDSYDQTFTVPKILNDAGIKFCLTSFRSWRNANLPFSAAQTVSFGLDNEEALRSITLSTAEILGIDDQLGSLDIGKKATIVVSDGDILDHLTHKVTLMFIEGRKIDLNNKHKELFEKYRVKKYSKIKK